MPARPILLAALGCLAATVATVTAEAQAPPAKPAKPRAFELTVVGPGGKPVPGAAVELRGDPPTTRDRVRKGRFVRQGPFGTTVLADASGRIAIEFPRAPTRLEAFIEIPGYGPYWAGWSSETHHEAIPDRFTAELETAWSVGGIVVDAEGQPIAGAEVHPGIEFKKRPGDGRQLGSGWTARTDDDGRWHIDTVPTSMAEVSVSINHPGHRPYHRLLTRREFGIPTDRPPSARIVLERGLTISGRIIDEAGRPIAGARVRTKFANNIREAQTDLEGQYRIEGCEPRAARIVASAVGRATDMKEVTVEPKMGPVDFRMKPGGTVRVRVVDQQGRPVRFRQGLHVRQDHIEFVLVLESGQRVGSRVARLRIQGGPSPLVPRIFQVQMACDRQQVADHGAQVEPLPGAPHPHECLRHDVLRRRPIPGKRQGEAEHRCGVFRV